MSERNCEKCIFAKPYGGPNDNRCSAWECDFIDRHEAAKAYYWYKKHVEGGEQDDNNA